MTGVSESRCSACVQSILMGQIFRKMPGLVHFKGRALSLWCQKLPSRHLHRPRWRCGGLRPIWNQQKLASKFLKSNRSNRCCYGLCHEAWKAGEVAQPLGEQTWVWFPTPMSGGSQPPLPLAPENLTPPSGSRGHRHSHVHSYAHIQKVKNSKEILFHEEWKNGWELD